MQMSLTVPGLTPRGAGHEQSHTRILLVVHFRSCTPLLRPFTCSMRCRRVRADRSRGRLAVILPLLLSAIQDGCLHHEKAPIVRAIQSVRPLPRRYLAIPVGRRPGQPGPCSTGLQSGRSSPAAVAVLAPLSPCRPALAATDDGPPLPSHNPASHRSARRR